MVVHASGTHATAPRLLEFAGQGGAVRTGLQIPDWSLLSDRSVQSPIDDDIRRLLLDVFFPNDAVSIDISASSPMPFAGELRDMFSVYSEKQVRDIEIAVWHFMRCSRR